MNPSPTVRQFPNAISSHARRILGRRHAAVALLVAGGVVAVLAMNLALTSTPAPDFRLDPTNARVEWVRPGGKSWADGIRSGDTVVRLTPGDTDAEWALLSRGPGGATHGSSSMANLEHLRLTIPYAVAAVGFAALAVFLVRMRWQLATAVALLAVALSSVSLASTALPVVAIAAALGVPMFLAAWVAADLRRELRPFLGAVVLGVSGAWLVAWLAGLEWYLIAEAVRASLVAGLLVLIAWFAAPWRSWIRIRLEPDVVLDVAALMAVISSAAFAVAIGVAPWLVAPAAVGLVALYSGVRGRLGLIAEHALFGAIRDQAAIAATEEERARLASEIHDGPLQELAAVITELDEQRHLGRAAATLRGVAIQLRSVTTALRPPVLDDLGLAAGIGWLVDQLRERAPRTLTVGSTIDDRTSVRRAGRPPNAVELAVFRIAQEALNNALHHSGASRISISVMVAADAIDLAVVDDGRGLGDAATREARRSGRLGLPSMRQRAASIGADLTISGGRTSGTQVLLQWKLA